MEFRPISKENASSLELWKEKQAPFDLSAQMKLLNSIPNFHKWTWDKPIERLSYDQRLPTCTRVYPGSPRHRIIQAINGRNNPGSIIHAVLQNLEGEKVPVYQKTKPVLIFNFSKLLHL